MQPLRYIKGVAAPLPIANLDTDQIMPKQFLKGINKDGLEKGLFYDLRFDGNGQPRPDFVLNQKRYADADVLLGADNFGCGSSREHAVWGLMQYGIRAVVAPSFGEIFYSNAINNRLLVAQVCQSDVDRIMAIVNAQPGTAIALDIQTLTIEIAGETMPFLLAPRYQDDFLEGLDMIETTLKSIDDIKRFSDGWARQAPWLANVGSKVAASEKNSKVV